MAEQFKFKCKLGFDCASMMQTPGLDSGECLNKENCGLLAVDETGQRLPLYCNLPLPNRPLGRSLFSRTSAALSMLMIRGCPQNLESLGVSENIDNLYAAYGNLNDALNEFVYSAHSYFVSNNQAYIAPPEIESHRYNVKRNYKTYWYNKLTANTAIFQPSNLSNNANNANNVKVIHLSKDTDPRNIIAREGIEKRNKLTQVNTKIQQANQLLQEALELLNNSSSL